MDSQRSKTIDSLVNDIKRVLVTPTQLSAEDVEGFARNIVDQVVSSLAQSEPKGHLRMSNLGTECNRKLWYQAHAAEQGESLSAEARLKFLYGHILEALLVLLAKAAGHKVTGEQDVIDLHGVPGHRDCVIDGITVDVKSASTFAFQKFEKGLTPENDSFGYLTQLGGYVRGHSDPGVSNTKGAFLAVDKQLGNIVLDVHDFTDKDYGEIIQQKKAAINQTRPPERTYAPEPDGKSGNQKLGTVCGYCQFKFTCYPQVRGYAYSNGPRYLTHVEREPDVPRFR